MRRLVVAVALLALVGCKGGGTKCHHVDVLPADATELKNFGFSSLTAEIIETADGVKIREYDEGKLVREVRFKDPQRVECGDPFN